MCEKYAILAKCIGEATPGTREGWRVSSLLMQTERGPFLSNPFVARAARWGLLAWSLIGVLVLAWVILRYVLYPIRIVFAPLVVALIVIYLLNPMVTVLQRRRLRRGLATLIVYVVVLTAIGVALAYLVQV